MLAEGFCIKAECRKDDDHNDLARDWEYLLTVYLHRGLLAGNLMSGYRRADILRFLSWKSLR